MRCFYSPLFELPLPAGHIFNPSKYRVSQEMLLLDGILRPEEVVEVEAANIFLLRSVHDNRYIERISQCTLEKNEQRILGFPPSPELYSRCATEVEATRLACRAAMVEGLAVCLGGGMHNAYESHGETFSVFNDIAIAIRDLQTEEPHLRIMVVDTDALQGAGLNSLLINDPNVFLYSLHAGAGIGGSLAPEISTPMHREITLPEQIKNDLYLHTLFSSLADSLDSFHPDLVIWIAGSDQLKDDYLGRMNLTPDDLIRRDEVILSAFIRNRIPCAVLYGGGYNRNMELTARTHRNTVATAKKLGSKYLNI